MSKTPKVSVDQKTAEAIAAAFEEVATWLKGSYGQANVVRALVDVAARLRSGRL